MMDNLDMDGLRAFVAIVDNMSFSRAGEAIGRSQSAISLRLRRLELSLGVSLLVRRQGRVVEVTPAGHKLLDYARKIIGLNDAALRDLTQRGHGRIRLGLPADFIDMGFADALAQVRPQMGDVGIEIETDVSDRLRARCEAGDLDLAFYKHLPADGGGNVLMHLTMAWAAGADFDAGDRHLPLVCFPEGCAYRRTMMDSLRAAGIGHQTVVTTPSLDSLRQAVRSGIGVTALPTALVTRDHALAVPDGLPALDTVGLSMVVTPGGNSAVRRLADGLGDSLRTMTRH